jgi:hypothetical protein
MAIAPRAFRTASISFGFGPACNAFNSAIAAAAFGPNRASVSTTTASSAESHRAGHPMFGEITREEWDTIHLNHANLHMSFLVSAS